MRIAPCVAAIALFVCTPALPDGATDATRVESAHYVFTSEGPADEAAEFSRVLEAAWPQLETFFGAAPKLAKDERLRVRFFESDAAMRAAIAAAGGAAPEAGGYYCPVAKTAYAWRQPSRWYTRTLVLHEATHQFHRLGVEGGGKVQAPAWWEEGIAEHLSHHTWDGTTLRLGVVPPVSLEDRAAAALAAAAPKNFAPEKIVDTAKLDRPNVMHLVRFLATCDAGKPLASWKELSKTLNRGAAVKPKDVMFGFATPAAFRERFVTWLRTVQQPLVSEFVEWDSLAADAVRGIGAVVAICRTRGDAAGIEATVAPSDEGKPFRVGVLLEWRGPKDYVIGEVTSGSRARVDRLADGKWATLHEAALPDGAGAAPWKVAAVRDGGGVRFTVGGAEVFTLASEKGSFGLCLDACTADFREIRMR